MRSAPATGRAAGQAAGMTPARSRLAGVARTARAAGLALLITTSAAVTSWLIGVAVARVSTSREAPWIVGRAAGTTAYLLLVALVALGLVLSHPWRTRIRRPSAAARIRMHVSLSAFTFAFLVLHVLVLATDRYAGVGLRGALLPLGATYRPVPVTLGLIGTYAGLLAGVTAVMAGHVGSRIWWPIHKVAAVSLVLVWVHGVMSGSDTPMLMALYLVTGGATLVLAVSRYAARTPSDRVSELAEARR